MKPATFALAFWTTLVSGCGPHPEERGTRTTQPVRPSTNAVVIKNLRYIKATLDKTVFKVNEPIIVHLVMRLTGPEVAISQNDYFHCFKPVVRSPSGSLMDFSASGWRYFDDFTGGSSQCMVYWYGYTDTYDFELERLYDFSLPGTYCVTFVRSAYVSTKSINDKENAPPPTTEFVGEISSNVLTFDIVR